MTAAALLAPPPPADWPHDYEAEDVTLVDADTYDVTVRVTTGVVLPFGHQRTSIDRVRVAIRLAGADAPDPKGSPAELEARAYVAGWFAAHRNSVRIRTSKPAARPIPDAKFGRWLGLLYARPLGRPTTVLADELLERQLARPWQRRR